MVDQTLPEIVAVHEKNKAIKHEKKIIEQQKKHELFIEGKNQLDKIANAYNKAENSEFKNLYKQKWFELVKVYAKKIDNK